MQKIHPSKIFSQLFNFNGIASVETQKFSAIITKLSNDYKLSKTTKFSVLANNLSYVYRAEKHLTVKSQLDYNCATPPSVKKHNYFMNVIPRLVTPKAQLG